MTILMKIKFNVIQRHLIFVKKNILVSHALFANHPKMFDMHTSNATLDYKLEFNNKIIKMF